MQKVLSQQVEANSISGTVKFADEILNWEQYNLKAINGSVNLSTPQNTSCKISASLGLGEFTAEIPLRNVVKSAPPNAQTSQHSSARGALLNLSTYSGRIQIKRQ